MKIEISLDTKDAADLAGLRALIAALDGGATVLTATAESISPFDGPLPEIGAIVAPLRPYDPREPEDASKYDYAEDDGEPAPVVTNPEGAPDVDSRGLPWDERIHAGTKATNADGSWRNKRGVDKALLEAVEAELGVGAVPNAPTDAPAATASGAADAEAASEPVTGNEPSAAATPTGGTPSAVPAAGEVPNPPAPAAEASATTIPEAPASPSADAPTFKDAMAIVTTRQREGTLTQVQVSEAAQALGLSSVVDLAKPANAEHIAAFIALLG